MPDTLSAEILNAPTKKRRPPMRLIRVGERPPDVRIFGDKMQVSYPGEPGVVFLFDTLDDRDRLAAEITRALRGVAPTWWEQIKKALGR